MPAHLLATLIILISSLLSHGVAQATSYDELTICDDINGVCWDIVYPVDNTIKVDWNNADTLANELNRLNHNNASDWHIPFSTDPATAPMHSDGYHNTIHSELGYIYTLVENDPLYPANPMPSTFWMAVSTWDEQGYLAGNWDIDSQTYSTWELDTGVCSWGFDFSNGYHFRSTINVNYSPIAIRSYAVPEPTTGMLLTGGLGFLAGLFRRKKHRASN